MTPLASLTTKCAACGVSVEPERAFGRIHRGDGVRHFCTPACVEHFLHREVGASAELPAAAWLSHLIDRLRDFPRRTRCVGHERILAEPRHRHDVTAVNHVAKADAGEPARRPAAAPTIAARPFASHAQPTAATSAILGT